MVYTRDINIYIYCIYYYFMCIYIIMWYMSTLQPFAPRVVELSELLRPLGFDHASGRAGPAGAPKKPVCTRGTPKIGLAGADDLRPVLMTCCELGRNVIITLTWETPGPRLLQQNGTPVSLNNMLRML